MIYLTLEQVIQIHEKTIQVSGGGMLGCIDTGKLSSVLEHIKNDEYYPDIVDKLTHLFFCACKFHCFIDGNKRIAIASCSQFLLQNGYMHCSATFIRQMENISYHVASGKINKILLHNIINAIIYGNPDDEELKLEILKAIK